MCFMIAVYWLIEGSEDPAKELKKRAKMRRKRVSNVRAIDERNSRSPSKI